jgi:AcrR family transcriptional regulator
MVTQEERSQSTRGALMDAGRMLFAERGYAEVSVSELAQRSGVTTGALYHQFGSKEGLFTAIYTELVDDSWGRIVAARNANAQPSLIGDCEAYLNVCSEPAFHRITADAPAVIGWDQLVDGTRAMIRASLTAAYERGEIANPPLEPLVRMLAAAFKEAGVMIATADDPEQARAEASESARHLFAGLLTSGPNTELSR